MTMIVSFSEIAKFQTCKRQYNYRFGMGLKPIEESGAISLGIKGHNLLEMFYKLLADGKTKEEALVIIRSYVVEQMKKSFDPDFNALKAWTLVENYINETDFTSSVVYVESAFIIPASSLTDDPFFADVKIGFTPDLVLERKGGWLDIEDYKFTERIWSQKRLNRAMQLRLYQIFLETLGYEVSRTVFRFFNVKTGKIVAHPYIMSATQKKSITADFLDGVRDVVVYRRNLKPTPVNNGARTLNNTACGFCAFEFVCTLEAEGKDASHTIKYQFTKSGYGYANEN